MLGEMALKSGLIDKIGGMNEVKDYLKTEIGTEPIICEEEAGY
jgi:ClpP class serine protease